MNDRTDAVERGETQPTPLGATDVRDTADVRDTTDDSGFMPSGRMDTLRSQWSDVQASFVDDPQRAVQQAHGLVTQIVDELTQTFSRERSTLEGQWSGGGQADTEALRVALQRYRSFFNRLLGTA
ncbi:MAG: hypothetical protein ABR508_11590 [Candidatus Baltobacteraceae bacterium]